MKDKKLYLQIIQDLSEEIGISKNDTKSLVDVALSSVDIKKVKVITDDNIDLLGWYHEKDIK